VRSLVYQPTLDSWTNSRKPSWKVKILLFTQQCQGDYIKTGSTQNQEMHAKFSLEKPYRKKQCKRCSHSLKDNNSDNPSNISSKEDAEHKINQHSPHLPFQIQARMGVIWHRARCGGTCSLHGFDMGFEMLLLFWSASSQHVHSLL